MNLSLNFLAQNFSNKKSISQLSPELEDNFKQVLQCGKDHEQLFSCLSCAFVIGGVFFSLILTLSYIIYLVFWMVKTNFWSLISFCFPYWIVIFYLGRSCHQSRADLQGWYQLWHQVGQVEIFERITISIQKCNPTPGPLVSWRVPPSKSRLRFCWRHQLPRPLQLYHSNQVLRCFPRNESLTQSRPQPLRHSGTAKSVQLSILHMGPRALRSVRFFCPLTLIPTWGFKKKLAFSVRYTVFKRC